MLGRYARLSLSMQTVDFHNNELQSRVKGGLRTTSARPLWSGFVRSASEFPDRPAALVDGSADSLAARHFDSARLLTVKGASPRWQFCHIDDLIGALELAIAGEVAGNFAVGCDGWLEQDEVERISGLRRIELPAGLTFGTAQRLHRVGINPAPVNDLRYLVYPWVVDCQALRAAGWHPAWDNAAVLEALMEARAGHRAAGRRLPSKEVTITAAAGTVAVIGTAAVVRAARRRKRGS